MSHFARCVTLLCLILIPVVGCGGGDSATGSIARRSGSLEYALTTTKAVFAHGEQVPLTFTVKNIGSQTVNVVLGACYPVDTKVTSGGQAVFQQTLYVNGCAATVTFISIAPGETKSYSNTWPQIDLQGKQVSAGQYTLTSWYQPYNNDIATLSPGNQETNEIANPVQITVQ